MLKRTIAITAGCAMLALFAGCSNGGNHPFREETLLDKNWGRSVETAKYNQTLDPEAGKNVAPIEGLNGKAAGYTVDKYENSFREKIKQDLPTTTTILK
jgi:hypothetical protein